MGLVPRPLRPISTGSGAGRRAPHCPPLPEPEPISSRGRGCQHCSSSLSHLRGADPGPAGCRGHGHTWQGSGKFQGPAPSLQTPSRPQKDTPEPQSLLCPKPRLCPPSGGVRRPPQASPPPTLSNPQARDGPAPACQASSSDPDGPRATRTQGHQDRGQEQHRTRSNSPHAAPWADGSVPTPEVTAVPQEESSA